MNRYYIISVLMLIISFTGAAQDSTDTGEKAPETRTGKFWLNEVSVFGKEPEAVTEVPRQVYIITRDEIELNGYRTLKEIINNIPGFYAINDYSRADVTLGSRGYWSEHTQNVVLMVNGISQKNDFTQDYPLDRAGVPVEAIDRVEITYGPGAVLRGNGAALAEINIITNRLDDDSSPFIISGSMGSFGEKKLFLRTAGKHGYINFVVNTAVTYQKGPSLDFTKMTSDPLNYLPSSDFSSEGLFEEETRYLNFSADFRGFYSTVNFSEAERYTAELYPSIDKNNGKERTAIDLAVGYNKYLSDEFGFDGKFSYHRTQTKWDFVTKAMGINPYGSYYNNVKAYEVALDGFFLMFENFDITFGFNHRFVLEFYEDVDMPYTGLENYNHEKTEGSDLIQEAAYMNFKTGLSESLKLVAGFRFGHQSATVSRITMNDGYPDKNITTTEIGESDVFFAFNLASIYNFGETDILKLYYSSAPVYPTFHTLARYPDSDIKAVTISTLEANYSSALSDRMNLNMGVFTTSFSNLVAQTSKIENDQVVTHTASDGSASTLGFDLLMQSEFADDFIMDLGFTYHNTTDDTFDNVPGLSPQNLLFFNIGYTFGFNASIAANIKYTDAMEAYWDDSPGALVPGSSSLNPVGRLGVETEAYIDAGLNIRFEDILTTGTFFNFRLSNLLGAEIHYPATMASQWADKGTLAPGTIFLFSAGWKY